MKARWWAAGVGLFLAATAPWTVPVSADGAITLRTALSLRLTGTFRLPPAAPGTRLFSHDVFRKAPGPVEGIVEAYPPLGTLLRVVALTPSDVAPKGTARGRVADGLLQLLPVVLTALTVLPLSGLARLGGCTRIGAPLLASSLLVTTFLGPLGRLDFQEPLLVFLSASALERALLARRLLGSRRHRALAAAGAFFACAFLAKPTALVLLPSLLLALARPRRGRPAPVDGAAFAAGAMPGLALFLLLNAVRFGDALDLGYRWTNAPPEYARVGAAWTLLRLTLLPNRGVLWFAPILLLGFWSLRRKLGSIPRRVDLAASAIAVAGFFFANVLWWSWEGGFGWGPRLLAPAVALSVPWLAGRGITWRRAALLLGVVGFAINAPAYLLDYGRIYEVAASLDADARPLGPAVPIHRNPEVPGTVHRLQIVHYSPRHASWLMAPPILARLLIRGEGPDTGFHAGGNAGDAALLRALTGKTALRPWTGVGRALLDDASATASVEPDRALTFALASIDFGGPAGDSRALASYLLLRAGRPAEAARLCREGLALEPGRPDLRTNLEAAEARLRANASPPPPP